MADLIPPVYALEMNGRLVYLATTTLMLILKRGQFRKLGVKVKPMWVDCVGVYNITIILLTILIG